MFIITILFQVADPSVEFGLRQTASPGRDRDEKKIFPMVYQRAPDAGDPILQDFGPGMLHK
jgi:hypothetical protein